MALNRDRKYIWFLAALLALSFVCTPAFADENRGSEEEQASEERRRATLQERFSPKENRFFAHLAGTAIVRDDFYQSVGYGLDVGYFFNETWGVELRAQDLRSRLAHAGEQMRDEYGYVPDMRAPQAMFTGGGRLSWGYGKVLTPGPFVVHFDPQLTLHGGITLAEERIVPTATTGLSFFAHFQYGIQVKLDLQMSLHFENRDRGIVPATGFAPVLGIGWSPQWGGST